jgi:hypothetical protein
MAMILQVAGSLMILAAFAAAQARWMTQADWAYLALNLSGSSLLAVDAIRNRQWGFVLLEVAWSAVSAFGMLQRARGVRPRSG